MEAAFALLVDLKVANLAREIAWLADQQFRSGMETAWRP